MPGLAGARRGLLPPTCSAAGLLTAIGDAPYAVTKHAAVAFAEWLSMTYGDRGIKVSALCPQGVDTPMLHAAWTPAPGERAGRRRGARARDVADAVVEGLAEERFLILPHPEVLEYFRRKASDSDRWLAGMRRLRRAAE